MKKATLHLELYAFDDLNTTSKQRAIKDCKGHNVLSDEYCIKMLQTTGDLFFQDGERFIFQQGELKFNTELL